MCTPLCNILTIWMNVLVQNAVNKPSKYFGRWVGTFIINIFIVVWVLIVGFGFGGWASMINFVNQIDTFGLFTKCYQCPPQLPPSSSPPNFLNATAPLPPPTANLTHPHRPWPIFIYLFILSFCWPSWVHISLELYFVIYGSCNARKWPSNCAWNISSKSFLKM